MAAARALMAFAPKTVTLLFAEHMEEGAYGEGAA
jgi:hypothetical protein